MKKRKKVENKDDQEINKMLEEYGPYVEGGEKVKRAKVTLAKGKTYEGEWNGDKHEGYGVAVWSDGA